MKLWLLWVSLFFYSNGVVVPYDGNNLLAGLGQASTSQTFKDFTKYWLLDKAFENRSRGIKVYINPLNDKIESITLTGEVPDLSEIKFIKYHAKLPLNISLDDDTSTLISKLGRGEKLIGRSTLRFHCDSLTIDANYNNLKKGKITYLTFSNETGAPLVIANVVASAKKQALETAVLQQPVVVAPVPLKPLDTVVLPPFKRAILDVFKSSRETTFNSIKGSDRTEGNFWNYKYTYNTSIKIPGEKYNMLYSFPFVTSQLDFVSVLRETDIYDKQFEMLYHDFEKKLTENFPASEGWVASCLPGKTKNQLPNLEFRNDGYGAIILDYTKSPAGKHILYLRFLLFAN